MIARTPPILLEADATAGAVVAQYDYASQRLKLPEHSDFWSAVKHAHSLGRRGKGYRIAVIDTDCDLRFGQLRRCVVKRKSWVPEPASNPDLSHGTAVGLLISAIAPECELEYHCVVTETGVLDEHAICDAIMDAATSSVAIINLSLGRATRVTDQQLESFLLEALQSSPLDDPRLHLHVPHDPDCALCKAAEFATKRKVAIIAAAGNSDKTVFCPARSSGVQAAAYMASIATVFQIGDELAERSAVGKTARPQAAVCDHTVLETDGFPGTSFAAPIVTGAATLCETPEEFNAYKVVAKLDQYSFELANTWNERSIDANEFAERRKLAREYYKAEFSHLPHVHCQFQQDIRNDLPWTDPSSCPTCGIFAHSTLINGGLFLLELHELDNALSVLWAAHQLMPWSAKAAANLAKTLELQGDPKQAVELYDEALRLRPGFEVYERTREQNLERLSKLAPEREPEKVTPTSEQAERARSLALEAINYFQPLCETTTREAPKPATYDASSVSAMEEASRLGNSLAQFIMARAHLQKYIPHANETIGIELLHKAAYADLHFAEFDLGVLYVKGWHGLPRDWRRAVQWFKRAAEQDHPEALRQVVIAHERGLGVRQSYRLAFEWLERAAKVDSPSVQRLGYYLVVGVGGLPRNYQRAVECFRKGASIGSAEAKYDLGLAYERGQGVRKDLAQARKWFSEAAQQGDESARKALDRIDRSHNH